MNERRIRVAARRDLTQAVVATGIPHMGRPEHARASRELAAMMPQVAGIRRSGSAALDMAYVAAGRYDAYWEWDLNPWDLAAGIILVREAGGFVSDMNGGSEVLSKGSVLASNENLTRPVQTILKKARSA